MPDKEEPTLTVTIKGASVDHDLDEMIKLALADVNVKGMRSHIDDEFIIRELVRLVKSRSRDSAKVDALRTLSQVLGLLGATDRNSGPSQVHVHFDERLAPSEDGAKVEGKK